MVTCNVAACCCCCLLNGCLSCCCYLCCCMSICGFFAHSSTCNDSFRFSRTRVCYIASYMPPLTVAMVICDLCQELKQAIHSGLHIRLDRDLFCDVSKKTRESASGTGKVLQVYHLKGEQLVCAMRRFGEAPTKQPQHCTQML